MNREPIRSSLEEKTTEYTEYLAGLAKRAFEKRPFDALCTFLRLGFLAAEEWDPYLELVEAFDDFNWVLQKVIDERPEKSAYRVGLLMYCQSVEMTVPHEVLANFLRCVSNQPFLVKPFRELVQLNKKKPFASRPPSASSKFKTIKKWPMRQGRRN